MSSLKNAIYNLLRKETVCCLCFEAIETSAIRIDDEVFMDVNDKSSNVELSEVLAFIFGSDVGDLASETLCKQCAVTAINCYTFIKKCKENSQNFQQSIESLDNCLQDATKRITFSKTLFVSLDASYDAKVYYDKRPVTKRSDIVNRFKSISGKKHAHYYLQDIKNQDDLDADIEAPTVIKDATKFKNKMKKTNDLNADIEAPTVKKDATKVKDKTKKATEHTTISLPKELILHKDSKASAHKCKICLKTFRVFDTLRQHYLRIHVPKKFKCSICQRSYGTYNFLETHLRHCHITKVCAECGKTFNNEYSLRQHEIGHRMRFVCQKCGRVYKNKDTFKDHIESGVCGQTGRKSKMEGHFICDICKKRFARKNTLRDHIRTEHGEKGKPHVCSWCDKKFSCQSRLKEHIITHTQEKKFSCELCGGRFVTKASLLYHTRIHTGEKPYQCSSCGERFLNSSRRAAHVRRYHTDATISCDVCSAKFKDHACLLRHKQKHSNTESGSLKIKRKKRNPKLKITALDRSASPTEA